eukprot:554459-Pleurochrysis_carterae.AAC.1
MSMRASLAPFCFQFVGCDRDEQLRPSSFSKYVEVRPTHKAIRVLVHALLTLPSHARLALLSLPSLVTTVDCITLE